MKPKYKLPKGAYVITLEEAVEPYAKKAAEEAKQKKKEAKK